VARRKGARGREATKGVIPGRYSLSVGCPSTPAPPGWKWTSLLDVARLESGHTPSRRHPEYWSGNIPWIGIRDARAHHGREIFTTRESCTDLGLANSAARLLPAGTVCLSRTASIGYIMRLGLPMATSQDFVNWVCEPDRLDPRFLMYVLLADVDSLFRFAHGSTHQTIYYPEVKAFHVCLPPLPTQRRIASILSAYDDLIENNTKRIKILEEMARALYREWFIHFRFPGHEKVKLVDSPLGQIPEGWKIRALSSIAETHRGRSYRTVNLLASGGYPFLNLKNIARDGGFRYDGTKRYDGPFKPHQTARPGDIVVAVTDMTQERRIVARAARVPELGAEFAVCSMDLVRVAPLPGVEAEYLYSFIRYSPFPENVKNHAHGTNVLHLNPDRIRGFGWCHPPSTLQQQYAEIAAPMRRLAGSLDQENAVLAQTRDLLLPRLISGEIDVDKLDLPEPP